MAVIGTFGSFTTARLALYASQGSMNVTGNNIANINTKGYTRQRMDLVSLNSTGQAKYANNFMVDIGYGVLCDRTSQLRDPFLDIRYRDKNSQLGQAETWQGGMDEIASILDETARGKDDFGIVEKQLGELFDALEELSQRAGIDIYDNMVRGEADTLCTLLNSAAKDIESVHEKQEMRLKDNITEANALLTEIRDLNKQIREHSIYGDSALELRDARNVALDELSKLMHINVEYSMEKLDQYTEVEKLTVTLANSTGSVGKPIKLVDGVYGTQLLTPEKVPMVNPNYPKDGKGMYLTIEDATTDPPTYGTTNDLMLDANGNPTNPKLIMVNSFAEDADDNQYLFRLDALKDENGRYIRDEKGAEVTTQEYIGDTVMTGALQGIREMLTEEGVFASAEDIMADPDAASKRGVRYYMAVLDSMARQFAEQMNKANQMDPSIVYKGTLGAAPNDTKKITFESVDGGNVKKADGADMTWKDVTVLDGDDEKTVAEKMKNMEILKEKGVLEPEYDYYKGGVLFSNRSDNNDPTGITAKNISVSVDWQNGTTRVLQSTLPKKENGNTTANDNINHIISIYDKEFTYLPESGRSDAASDKEFFKGSFEEFFDDIQDTLALEGRVSNAKYVSYATESLDLENSRLSVSGVDLNEEATSMMQFSKSYSAACRLLTTLDSMLEQLINNTI